MILNVRTTQGTIPCTVYTVKTFPYHTLFFDTVRKRGKRNITYYNVPCAFDIETTTIVPDPETADPYAFMYHWQACINSHVVFGRTWEEFQTFLDKLRFYLELGENKRLVMYVHNLAYEFQFMKEFIHIDSMFAKDARKPMYILSKGIEFRCSYFLSNMSLAKFCENSELCTFYKLENKYDYRKIRTQKTPLTQIEQEYCYNDVRGLCQCIETLMQDDNLATIPMTNTGYVRRDYRRAMNTKELRMLFYRTGLTPEQYQLCKDAFRGGNTHANRYRAGNIIENVFSYDETSAYIYSLMCDYYPMSDFEEVEIKTEKDLQYYTQNYCCLMRVIFKNIAVKADNAVPYIPISICSKFSDVLNDNGRILSASYLEIPLTEIDLEIIQKTYSFESFVIKEFHYALRDKLPRELLETMLKYYDDKTILKGIDKMVYEYMKSKNRLNATFGMIVTDVAHSEIEYQDHKWIETKPNIKDALDTFYNTRSSFLPYQWGIWVTAHSRKHLQDMIDKVGLDLIYTDTDSIKFTNEKHCKEFEQANKKIVSICQNNAVRAFSEKDGRRYYLGVWDNETEHGAYKQFKTLGAKKYCYVDEKNELHITVSGLNKKTGAQELNSIEEFEIGKEFLNSGRTVSYYNEADIHTIEIEGCKMVTGSSIGIVDTTYTLGVTLEYGEIIGQQEKVIAYHNQKKKKKYKKTIDNVQ